MSGKKNKTLAYVFLTRQWMVYYFFVTDFFGKFKSGCCCSCWKAYWNIKVNKNSITYFRIFLLLNSFIGYAGYRNSGNKKLVGYIMATYFDSCNFVLGYIWFSLLAISAFVSLPRQGVCLPSKLVPGMPPAYDLEPLDVVTNSSVLALMPCVRECNLNGCLISENVDVRVKNSIEVAVVLA